LTKVLGREKPVEILPPASTEIVRSALRMGQTRLRLETRTAGRTISWSFFPIAASRVVHCYAVDNTDRLVLEAQLRQSQKMESVGQLAGGVAHDFNNILTVIQGHAALLEREPLSPELADSTQQIVEAAERAANLTRQLLAFSRRQVLQPRNLDLNDVVCAMARMLQRLLGEDIVLGVHYAANLPPVHADPGMLEQVLLNLAVNSRDAMPKGGQLEITLKAVALDRERIRAHSQARPGTFVQLSVTDTGTGIPPEILERIFEPFFTTKDVGSGTGLGLPTVYGIVQQHHGWIEVRSEVGHGTAFDIYLPASDQPAAVIPIQNKTTRGGRECILLVEDEDPLRELVRSVLEAYGYKVIEAASGRLALDVWKGCSTSVDLLLTDIVMPDGVTGSDLADALKQEKPGLRVLFSSGYSSDIIGKDFVLSDGVNFLQKPYNPHTLAQTVRDCLDR
jgi:two-component system cell cycle sensor histidine kinase/response regulator CckA